VVGQQQAHGDLAPSLDREVRVIQVLVFIKRPAFPSRDTSAVASLCSTGVAGPLFVQHQSQWRRLGCNYRSDGDDQWQAHERSCVESDGVRVQVGAATRASAGARSGVLGLGHAENLVGGGAARGVASAVQGCGADF
jgi:hypothetical protein